MAAAGRASERADIPPAAVQFDTLALNTAAVLFYSFSVTQSACIFVRSLFLDFMIDANDVVFVYALFEAAHIPTTSERKAGH
jgi:hypothetical protein